MDVAGFSDSLIFGTGAKRVPMVLMTKHIGGRNGLCVIFMANKLLAISSLRRSIISRTAAHEHEADQEKNDTHGLFPRLSSPALTGHANP